MGKNYKRLEWQSGIFIFQCGGCPYDTPDEGAMIDHQRNRHMLSEPAKVLLELPKISCILPIYNRPNFLRVALYYFFRYDYPNKELVIVDDSEDSLRPLIPESERINYIRMENRGTVGEKRNIACENATGEIIAHHDSDDWYSPNRLTVQLNQMMESGREAVGIREAVFLNIQDKKAWQYTRKHATYVIGATLMYTKSLWEGRKFSDVPSGEDTGFVMGLTEAQILSVKEGPYFVAIDHGENTDKRGGYATEFRSYDIERVSDTIGNDWYNYYEGEVFRVGRKVLLSALMGPHLDESLITLESMLNEVVFLNQSGEKAELYFLVNGSKEVEEAINLTMASLPITCGIKVVEESSASVCKNLLLKEAARYEYLFTTEAGVKLVRGSVLEMLRVIGESGVVTCHQSSGGESSSDELTFLAEEDLKKTELKVNFAYSLWRSAAANAVRFEEDDVFKTPGTGLEDNDIQFSLIVSGFVTRYFVRMKYLHTGSRCILSCNEQDWRARQSFLIGKWNRVPEVSNGPLRYL